jgi:hypothetical protein
MVVWKKLCEKGSFFKNDILEFPRAKGIVVSGDIHGDFIPSFSGRLGRA